MQRFLPNTVLQDRFLLREELAVEQQTGQQLWAVLDQQTGQSLIARFYADGRTEWFNDNRPSVSAAPPMVTPPPPTGQKKSLVAPQSPTVSNGRLFRFVLVLTLALGLVTGGYIYRTQLLHFVQALSTEISLSASTDSTSTITQTVVTSGPAGNESAVTAPVRSAPISATQAMHLLGLLRQIPSTKHATIFADARLAFTTLRQTPGNNQYVDSLYTVCMGRGAQSYLAHQQNGDSASKAYALNWYRMAYALKPSSNLRDRLGRLSDESRKPLAKRSAPVRKVRPRESLFINDPEVTH